MIIKFHQIRISLFFCLGLIGQLLLFSHESFGQRAEKQDYIIVGDSALSQGKVVGIPTENNQVVYFARSKRTEPIKYTIGEVTEFRVSERVFAAKEVQLNGKTERFFLEKLPQGVPGAVIWKLNGKPKVYFVENDGSLQSLGEDYEQVLSEIFENPDLEPLLEITNLSDFPLIYLSKTVTKFEKPRTFTKQLTLTPFVGGTSTTVGFTIPDSNIPAKIKAASPVFGFSGEIFMNFKRNLSLNGGLSWSQFDSQEFLIYEYNQRRFDSDIYLDFSLLQLPVSLKYYFDAQPNRLRIFGEFGYSYGMASFDKLGVFQAEYGKNSIITSNKTFELGETYSGLIWGFGVEKYLNKHRGIVLGLRNYSLNGSPGESMKGITFQLGYKF